MKLPEIQEIKSYRPEPGDILIFRNTEVEIYQAEAEEIKRLVRRQLNIPENVGIAVVGRDWEVTVGKLPE